ncbi:MAG TPA: hypothetical protein VFZ95_09845, partial [Steroidobacteraceae bacterium]
MLLLLVTAGTTAVHSAEGYTAPTTEAFLEGVGGYPFVAGAARREKIRAGVPKLKRCMASPEVRKLIGDPDFGYVAYKT